MGSILIAMPKTEDAEHIAGALRQRGSLLDIEICPTGADVLRISNARDFGVVVCTGKLRGMSYAELNEYLPDYFSMIVLTKDDSLEMLSDRMVRMLLPLKMRDLTSVIEQITNELYQRIRKKKKAAPKRTEAEQRLIDDAKHMLMKKNGLSEPEAFRYIQKLSMDTGRTFVESAQMLLLMNRNEAKQD